MSKSPESQLHALNEKWSAALAAGDMDLALEIAVQGYSTARSAKDRAQLLMFLGFVRVAATSLFEQASTRPADAPAKGDRCSFCLEQKTKLVRGVNVAICSDCIEAASATV